MSGKDNVILDIIDFIELFQVKRSSTHILSDRRHNIFGNALISIVLSHLYRYILLY